MKTLYYVLLGISVFVAVVFTGLVFLTGKGDAMSGGGGSVRTTFKGKASFDDQMFKFTVGLAGVFMALMVVLDVIANQAFTN
ncbi:MAG: preprotein translocase subunit SecG [Fimbriimonadaceae bacterium]|nr:preprotein translocase subunit SecG [Fimbriimonadaceae bacterium]